MRFLFTRIPTIAAMALSFALILGSCAPAPAPTATPPRAAPTVAAPGPSPTPRPPAPSPTPSPKYGGISKGVLSSEGPHMDHHQTTSAGVLGLADLTNDILVKRTTSPEAEPYDISPAPHLAKRWANPDPTTYIFYLNEGVKFQNLPPVNGRELTAEDVKWSYERAIKLDTTRQVKFKDVSRIEAVDRYTVKFTLSQPLAEFLETGYIYSRVHIAPKEVADADGDLKKKSIGTGPYILEEWVRGSHRNLRKNPDYWVKGLPYMDRIETVFMPDEATQKAAFITGQIDTYTALNVTEAEDIIKAVPGATLETVPSAYGWFWQRSDRPPFNDLKVRQAVVHALDKEAMAKQLRPKGDGKAAYEFMPSKMTAWYMPLDKASPEAQAAQKYDPELAKRLLAEAGYPNGFSTTHTNANIWRPEEMEIMSAQLAKVGIKTSLVLMEYPAYISGPWKGGPFEGFLHIVYTGWGTVMTPDEWLHDYLATGGRVSNSHHKDAYLDGLLEKQRHILDYQERKKVVWDILNHNMIQNYAVPLVEAPRYSVRQKWVMGAIVRQGPGARDVEYRWLNK